MILLFALIGIIAVFLIPCLIVGLWKSRPVLAFIVATIILSVTLAAPILLEVIVTYKQGDPELTADLISQAIVATTLMIIIFIPILFLFQWLVLRRHKKKLSKVDADKTFS